MMGESRDKGIIQRVIDHIYERFGAREDLVENCEIKVSFLEIYKEQVTDLLEGHVQPKGRPRKASLRNHSSSFAIHRVQDGGKDAENADDAPYADSGQPSQRTKARTFYGV